MHQGAPVSVTLSKAAGIDTPDARHAKSYLRMRPQNPPLCGDGGAGDPARQLLRGSGRESSRLVCGCAARHCDSRCASE